ncbi:hypothetical protein BLOT_003304 [Blomia tropicalis]|nr:hypothetical protein BLOT_003304 [Blomia tropicalis]
MEEQDEQQQQQQRQNQLKRVVSPNSKLDSSTPHRTGNVHQQAISGRVIVRSIYPFIHLLENEHSSSPLDLWLIELLKKRVSVTISSNE